MPLLFHALRRPPQDDMPTAQLLFNAGAAAVQFSAGAGCRGMVAGL